MGCPSTYKNACKIALFSSFFLTVFSLHLDLKLHDNTGQHGTQKITLVCFPTVKDGHGDGSVVRRSGKTDRSGKNNGSSMEGPLGIVTLRQKSSSPGSYSCYYRSGSKKRRVRQAPDRVQVESGTCPAGYKIEDKECFPCLPGSYGDGKSTECIPCPKNSYMPRKAADSCVECPGKRETLETGAESEKDCIDPSSDDYKKKKDAASSSKNNKTFIIVTAILILLLCVIAAVLRFVFGLTCSLKFDKSRGFSKQKDKSGEAKELLPNSKAVGGSNVAQIRNTRKRRVEESRPERFSPESESDEDHIYEEVKLRTGSIMDSEEPVADVLNQPRKSRSADTLSSRGKRSDGDSEPKSVMYVKISGSGDRVVPLPKPETDPAYLLADSSGKHKNVTEHDIGVHGDHAIPRRNNHDIISAGNNVKNDKKTLHAKAFVNAEHVTERGKEGFRSQTYRATNTARPDRPRTYTEVRNYHVYDGGAKDNTRKQVNPNQRPRDDVKARERISKLETYSLRP